MNRKSKALRLQSWRVFTVLTYLSTIWVATVHSAELEVQASYMPNELLVKISPNVTSLNISTLPQNILGMKADIERFRTLRSPQQQQKNRAAEQMDRWTLMRLPKGVDLEKARIQLANDPRVEQVEYNQIVKIVRTPNDARFTELWSLDNTGQTGGTPGADIDAPMAWNAKTDASDIVVAVIDTGVDHSHPDLKSNMWVNPNEIPNNGIDDDNNGYIDDVHGFDFKNNDADPFDDHGHGTHVAGTIAAVGNNGLGVTGVAWQARIMAVKFLGSLGSGTIADAIEAVLYATQMGANLSNNSWGGGGFSLALSDAIAAADEAGSLFVAAAGNTSRGGSNNDIISHYPSNYEHPNIVAVAATDHNDNRASFSHYGPTTVDLGAPGVRILSTVPTRGNGCCSNPSGYGFLSGTSMAAPHVSGAAVLLFSRFPQMDHRQVKRRLLNTVNVIPTLEGMTVSGGRLNIGAAMSSDDTNAPDGVIDLAATDVGSHFARLSWTATGDDGKQGRADRYNIRFSKEPINANNFKYATEAHNPPVPGPAGSAEAFTALQLESDTQFYFAMQVIDDAGNSSGLSNIVSVTTEPANYPDLTMSEFDVPSQGEQGMPITLHSTVCNTGVGMAPETTAGIYLSDDEVFDTTDLIIGERLVTKLDINQCDNTAITARLAHDLSPGNYYLIAVADAANAVVELDENNNGVAKAFIVTPKPVVDFAISAFGTATEQVDQYRSAIRGTYSLCNIGNSGSSDYVYHSVYLSDDPIITMNDRFLTSDGANVPAAGQCITVNYEQGIPQHLGQGMYYLGVIADAQNRVEELDETNNTSASVPLLVTRGQPDLLVSSVQGSNVALLGGQFSAEVDICNQGTSSALNVPHGIYLSDDADITLDDRRIGSKGLSVANEDCFTQVMKFTGKIPSDLAPGTYYWGAIADDTGRIAESNESNNALAGNKVVIEAPSADLVMQSLTGPSIAKPGESVNFTGVACNQGSDSLPGHIGLLYLSDDTVISNGDVQIGFIAVYANEEQCNDVNVIYSNVPLDVSPGEYYWGVVLDPHNAVLESNDDNNGSAGNAVTITQHE